MSQTFTKGQRVRIMISPYDSVKAGVEATIVAHHTRGTSGKPLPYGGLYEVDKSVGNCTRFWAHELDPV